MPFGFDFFDFRTNREFDEILGGSREDSYNSGYNAGYNDGQNAGLREGLKTGERNGAFDEARRIAFRLKELNVLTQEQIAEVTGIKPERMI